MKLRSLKSILNSMANWVKGNTPSLTNFTPGSVLRTLLEAVALEIEALYLQMHKGFRWALENSVLLTFGFTKQSSTKSSGTVRINVYNKESIALPEGTVFVTTPLDSGVAIRFETTTTVTILPFTEYVDIPVRSIASGEITNVPANSIRIAEAPIPGFLSITNPEPTMGGKDEETTENRKIRFNNYIKSLPRGTVDAIRYGTLEVQPTDTELEGVEGVYIIDTIGVVYVYAHDSLGNLSDTLRERIERNLKNYRAGGVEVIVLPATKSLIDLEVSITLDPSVKDPEVYRKHVENSLIAYLSSFKVSKSVIRADLYRFIMSLGNGLIINVELSLQDDIINTETFNIIRPGNVVVTLS